MRALNAEFARRAAKRSRSEQCQDAANDELYALSSGENDTSDLPRSLKRRASKNSEEDVPALGEILLDSDEEFDVEAHLLASQSVPGEGRVSSDPKAKAGQCVRVALPQYERKMPKKRVSVVRRACSSVRRILRAK